MSETIRSIAFYLPQFHPVPENDEWWGKGFTEWTNVSKARPLFKGHHQPHFPSDMGFYDLRLAETRAAQAELAKEHGVSGFCYYHYWFNGRRILNRPFDEVLASGSPDFPFCLCWANENWTRVWDGGENKVLLKQDYSDEDDIAHFESLIPAFRDPRYIRINGRPLFLVYRTSILPDPARTAENWRRIARERGIEDPYLVRVESFSDIADPRLIGFDASVAFAPFNRGARTLFNKRIHRLLATFGVLPKGLVSHRVLEYRDVAERMAHHPLTEYKRFHAVSPSWDNTARRAAGGMILLGSGPEAYRRWVGKAAQRTLDEHVGDERILFINAWNEWAEGNHLEPDMRFGRGFLEANREGIKDALEGRVECRPRSATTAAPGRATQPPATPPSALRRLYWHAANTLLQYTMTRREMEFLKFPWSRP